MTKLKTKLTRDEVQKLCDLYNAMDSILDGAGETFDVSLSDLHSLRNEAWKLRGMFEFRSQKHDEDPNRPAHWMPQVLPDDDRAWYYNAEH
jgi:hypothetical protein